MLSKTTRICWLNAFASCFSLVSFDFCQIVMNADDVKEKGKTKFPFCMVWGQDFIMATLEKTIDINSLDNIRTRFIELYFKNKHNKSHPNLLYDFQDEISKAGHLSAYNHWILMIGDDKGFETWRADNRTKWEDFLKWFTDNSLQVDMKNKFYRGQY